MKLTISACSRGGRCLNGVFVNAGLLCCSPVSRCPRPSQPRVNVSGVVVPFRVGPCYAAGSWGWAPAVMSPRSRRAGPGRLTSRRSSAVSRRSTASTSIGSPLAVLGERSPRSACPLGSSAFCSRSGRAPLSQGAPPWLIRFGPPW
jgi:hypothetical protein